MISDLKRILYLVFDLVFLYHPITLDIRYKFHVELARLQFREPTKRCDWEEMVVICNNYTLNSFWTVFRNNKDFRRNIINILLFEKQRLLENPRISMERLKEYYGNN